MQTNSPHDLRRWEREPVAIPVSLVLKADKLESETSTTTINISLSGVGVRTTVGLVSKQGVAIVIKGQFSQTIAARVVWVRKDESSNSTIAGLKFLLY
jgi:c-di-GMP-binding flagellar brake protein YcgR